MRMNILAIEPDQWASEILRETLTDLHNLTVVRHRRAAMQLLSGGAEFDLVLLNSVLPDTSGLEMLAELGREFPHLPVVMVLSLPEVRTFVQIMELGAVDYIVKPYHPGELRFLIGRWFADTEKRSNADDLRSVIQFAC